MEDTPVCVDISALDSLLVDPRFLQVKQEAEGKDLVLFLGAAGAGKSTCISYLLGAKIESGTDLSGETIAKLEVSATEVSNIKFPAINPGTGKAHTIYSEVFSDSVSGIHYCDTASFIDTQKTINEHEICASLSMQYAIQSAKSIRAIAIVFEWDIFRRNTPLELYASALILTQLLVNLESIADSIIFIINKVPQHIKKHHLAHSVGCYQAILTENIANLTPKTQTEIPLSLELERLKGVSRIINLLDTQIKQNPENIVFMDVFDGGGSREVMHALLRKKTNGINKELFNFREYHSKRKAFEEQITVIAPLMKEHRKKEKTKKDQIEKTSESYSSVSLPENLVQPNAQQITAPVSSENNSILKQSTPQANAPEDVHEEEDITAVLLNLVKIPESSVTETKLPEGINGSNHFDTNKTSPVTTILRSEQNASQLTPRPNIGGVLSLLVGMSLTIFGLFLLTIGLCALLHWTFALSMVQEIFPLALEESIFCGLIYGVLSTIFGGVISFMAWSICFTDPNRTAINNGSEDISHRNNYSAIPSENLQIGQNHNRPVVSQQARSSVAQHASDVVEKNSLQPKIPLQYQ